MISNLKIARLRDIITFEAEGSIDLAKIKEALKVIASVPGAFSEYDLLFDTRGAESYLSATDIWQIAKYLAEVVHSGPSRGFTAKIAVLCPVERFDKAQFLELCAQNRGLNVMAFTSFEEMFDWLSVTSKHD